MTDNSKPTQNAALSFEQWLGKAERLDGAATPGPWETVEDTARRGHIKAPVDDPEEGAFVTHCEECMGYVLNAANAEWIAHARTALPQAVAALQAVLDLHANDTEYGSPSEPMCEECNRANSEGLTYIEWPCPTVAAITEALGEE